MNDVIILKTNILGGFDRQQTLDYIEKLLADAEKNLCSDEVARVKDTLSECNASVEKRDRKISELQAKLDELSSPETKAQAASEYLRSIPELNFKKLIKNKSAAKARSNLAERLKTNSENAQNIFAGLAALNDDIEKISNELSEVSLKLDGISFDADKPIKKIEAPTQTEEAVTAKQTEDTVEIEEIEDFREEPIPVEAPTIKEETEQLFKNSVDNFFDELERLMNNKE